MPSRFDSHGVLHRIAPRLIWGSNSRSPTKQWASGYAPLNMQFFPQCYLGFGGEHLRLLLRRCDDKRIWWFWFLMSFKDQIVMTLFVRVWADAVQRPLFLKLFLLFLLSLIFIPDQVLNIRGNLVSDFCVMCACLRISYFCIRVCSLDGWFRVQIALYF